MCETAFFKMDVENTRTIKTVNTVLNADSVEWCPHLGMEDILLCGTYKLDESIPNNKVRVHLCNWDGVVEW